jgi:hypothetical protein
MTGPGIVAGLDSRDLRAKVCVSVQQDGRFECDGCVMQDGVVLMRLSDSAQACCRGCCFQYADTAVSLQHAAK